MRILIITGRLAEESVKRFSSESTEEVDVLTLPISVAAFITPEYAAQRISAERLQDYDMILLPGAVRGDVSPVEAKTGIPTFKGPVNAADLPPVLSLLGELELSKTVPASDLIRDKLSKKALKEIEDVSRNWRTLLKEQGGLVIGGEGCETPVGPAFPMRVIAEIVNAPTLDLEEIRRRAEYYAKEGAEIIDIGMLAKNPMPEKISRIIEEVRTAVNLPISIDTLEPSEIKAAVDTGVDLILSVDLGNLEEVASFVSDVPIVVLPSNMKQGTIPRKAEERVDALIENINLLKSLGLRKIIADPVLDPPLQPGLLESLAAYRLFRQRDLETPMLFGLGNATELIDVDSPGVNGLLTAMACEVDANLLFIPEYSVKARGSVRETATASKMMFIARKKDALAKDLGIDLLLLKEKRWREETYDTRMENEATVVLAKAEDRFEEDVTGWFKIEIDREKQLIVAMRIPAGKTKPDMIVKGTESTALYRTIIEMGLVSKLDHVAYLGKELEKAEIALRIGKAYLQDEKLF